MAARQDEENHEDQIQQAGQNLNNHHHYLRRLSSYLGLSFTVFLGFLPKNAIPLLSSLQSKNKALTFQLIQAEEQLEQLRSRRKEDSKANARVAEIFASHRNAWQQEEKRLLQHIDEGNREISDLKSKVENFERLEAELKGIVEDLKREVSERDDMISFMSRSNCDIDESSGGNNSSLGTGLRYGNAGVSRWVEDCFVGGAMDEFGGVSGQSDSVLDPSNFLNSSAASKLWSARASSWQDLPHQSHESMYHLKHFLARRESPWQDDSVSNGISSKIKALEQELQSIERLGDTEVSEVQLQMNKQAKRYQVLAGKIDNLCDRMKTSDPNEATCSSGFQTQRQTEFLLEAFRLQQRASEINDKLIALQAETKPCTKRSLDSVRNSFKEIQRNVEIWLARIIGDLEGSMPKDGASRAREYCVSRYPFVQS